MGFRNILVALLLAAAAGRGGAAVGPALMVISSQVRFAPDGVPGSRVSLKGDLLVGPRLADLDPLSDALTIRLGTLVLLDGPAPRDRTRSRATGRGWRIDYRGAPGNPGRVSLRLSPSSGLFTLKARGLDAVALRAAGPSGVPVELVAGGEAYASSVDFEESGDRRWSYRRAPKGHGPPGGGGQDQGGIALLGQGESSGITALRFAVIRDAAAWAALWTEHAGGGTPPAVDFAREMVVGLWLGARPSGGYSVEILRMVVPYRIAVGGWCPPPSELPIGAAWPCTGGTEVSGFLVDARETRPGPGCVVTQGVTHPFVIVRVPRVEGPGTYSYLLATRSCP